MEYSKLVQLHKEVGDFYKLICPTSTEYLLRGQVIRRIEKVLKRRWPQTVIQAFGSSVTGLCLTSSNIDVAVIGPWQQLPLFEIKRELLDEDVVDETRLKVFEDATPPLIELIDRLTELRVRIYFNGEAGIETTSMIKYFIELYPVLPKLFRIMKQFLHQRGLGEVFNGGLNSYCLTLMCIRFLQMHPHFNAFNANLGLLLIEFLQFFGETFNFFNTGISIRNGGHYVSKEELLRSMNHKPTPSVLCIQDPIEPRLNAGRHCFGILEVQRMFKDAHLVLMESLKPENRIEGSILGRIVRMGDRMRQYRKWLEEVCCK